MSDYTISADGLAKLEEELVRLEGPGRDEIAKRISIAREWGDLKENGEYHAAKESQAHHETRILIVRDQISKAVVAEAPAVAGSVVFGSKVTVAGEAGGKEQTFTLVGSSEADLRTGKLSIASPVAQALLGASVGDTVLITLPSGAERSMRVVTIE